MEKKIVDPASPIGTPLVHVLQVVGEPAGGIRKHIHSIIEGLDAERFCCSYAYSTTYVDARFQHEIDLLRGKLRGELPLLVNKKPHPSDLANLWKLIRYVKRNRVDIVHGHGAKGGLYARLVGMVCRVPAIYTPHGGVAHRMFGSLEDAVYTFVERCMVRFTHCFIFESNYTAASYLSKVGKISRPWLVNHNGIKCPPVDEVQSRSARETTKIGVFGILRREKGQIHLINAIASTIDSGHEKIRLHVYGDGPDRVALEQRVDSLGLREKVVFYGDVANPEQEMAKMDIIVIPSMFESFGYVGLEAMALRKPVIASAVGGLLEIFDEGTALLVPPGDEQALAQAICRYIQHPDEASKMATQGLKRCAKQFALEGMIETLSLQYLNAR